MTNEEMQMAIAAAIAPVQAQIGVLQTELTKTNKERDAFAVECDALKEKARLPDPPSTRASCKNTVRSEDRVQRRALV